MPTNTELISQAGNARFWFDPSDISTIVPEGQVTIPVTQDSGLYYWLDQNYPQNYLFNAGDDTLTYTRPQHYVDKIASRELFFKTAGLLTDYFLGSGVTEQDTLSFLETGIVAQKGYVYTTGLPSTSELLVIDSTQPGSWTYFGAYNARSDWSTSNTTWLFANKQTVTAQTPLLNDAREYRPDISSNTAGAYIVRTGQNSFVVKLTSSDGNILSSELNTIRFKPFTTNTLDFIVSLRVETVGSATTLRLYVGGVLIQTLSALMDQNGFVTVTDDAAQVVIAGQPFTFTGYELSSFGTADFNSNLGIGPMGEMLVFDGGVSDLNFSDINSYLQAKWVRAAGAVTFSALSTNVATAGTPFVTSLRIANAVSASLSTIAVDAGTGWTITNLNDGQGTWRISGTPLSSVTNFSFVITATNSDASSTITQKFPVIVTATGVITPGQTTVLGTPGLSLWFDPSDLTTMAVNQAGSYTYLREKVNSYGWNLRSSETISRDTSTFSSNGLMFSEVKYNSGFNTAIAIDKATCPELIGPGQFTGVPIADANDYSTLFMIVGYKANQLSVPDAAFYAIASDDYTTADQTLFGAWGVDTKNVGDDPLSILFIDNESASSNKPYRHYASEYGVPVGARAVIVWRYGPNGVSIRVNGSETTIDYLVDSGDVYLPNTPELQSGFIPPKAIGLLGSPQGYSIGSIGEIIAAKGALSDAQTQAVETYLTNKWLSNSFTAPTITTSSNLSQYIGQRFGAAFVITNGNNQNTVATLSTNAGTGWTIGQANTSDEANWVVNGVMPDVPGDYSFTITATTDGLTTARTFIVSALDRPIAPIIGDITPFQALVNTPVSATLRIINLGIFPSCTVSLNASSGSNWSIRRDAQDTALFHVNGTMPAVATTFQLSITAVNANAGNTMSSSTTRHLLMRSLAEEQQLANKFPLDLSGEQASNLIRDEEHTLTVNNGYERQMVVPVLAPFYGDGLQIKLISSGLVTKIARLGIDYLPICEFQQMGKACAKRIYGAIGFLNNSFEGTIRITYQTLGGDFVLDRNELYAKLADRIANPRQVQWSTVVGLDTFYPAAAHDHLADTDLVGMSSIVTTISSLAVGTARLSNGSDLNGILSHASQLGNPHNVTPAQIGLNLVNNYAPASVSQAGDPANTTTYLTPLTASAAGKSNLKNATNLVSGIAPLNLGTQAGDDSNLSSALTAAGVITMMNSASQNAVKTAFSGGQVLIQTTPAVLVFPLYWRGIQYRTLDAFIAAVSTAVGINPLQYKQDTSTFIFPQGVTPPSLVTTRSLVGVGTRRMTVRDHVGTPLKVYNQT